MNELKPDAPFQHSLPLAASPGRTRAVFVNLKHKLHLPGVQDLLTPCTQHLTASQYKRMLAAWQSLPHYQVFGFLKHSEVVGLLALELSAQDTARILALAISARHQGRGLGRRLVVESFCSLNLEVLTARTLADGLGFYQRLHFVAHPPSTNTKGHQVYTLSLTRQALYAAYNHEYSAGAVLFTQRMGERLYVLVTELSGNTGLPKGHVEAGETQEQTALREIFEETGLHATLLPGFGGEIVYPQGRGMLKHFTYYLASFDASQQLVSGPDVQAHLLPFEQALGKLSFVDVRTILKQAEAYLNGFDAQAMELNTD